MADIEKLATAMGDLDEPTVRSILQNVMNDGGDQASNALEACQIGMNIIGERFEAGEYYVGDLIYAGELMTDAVEILKEALTSSGNSNIKAKVILCTVKDDLHDIGKNIVKALMEANGFEVIDLGIDTSADQIIETIKNEHVHIIALSGVLTLAIDSMKDTVNAIENAGLRDETKIIVGGAPITEEARQNIGADAWALNPQKTISVCEKWAQELSN